MDPNWVASKNWRWVYLKRENTVIAAGGTDKAFDEINFVGWLVHGFGVFSAPTLQAQFIFTGPEGQFDPLYTPYMLNLYGLTSPSPAGILPWRTVYSAGPPPLYGLAFSPTFPGLPIQGKLQILLKNPEATPVTVYAANFTMIRITK